MNLKTAITIFSLLFLVSCASNTKDNLREVYQEFENPREAYPRR